MAGSITDMNRDSLASVSSSQDVHICCMTSSIDPVLLPIAIQLEYIFEKYWSAAVPPKMSHR